MSASKPSRLRFAVRSARVPRVRHRTLRALVMSDKGHAEPDVCLVLALVTSNRDLHDSALSIKFEQVCNAEIGSLFPHQFEQLFI